ncbi:patatin-like phospholipase/acyl hydrolase [Bradyrhizobium sp. AZCC 1588]|uniref:patatin-like phospholipase family protein n=1 Tax=unclassified Bradyrhizobium TaxID=2631580 RepID=UPI002FEF7036
MARKKLILTIDGGGVRGIVPALVLRKLEEKLKKRKKNAPIGSYFDLIAGTSTGGIIALGLCAPNVKDPTRPACTTDDLVNLYRTRSKEIFGSPQSMQLFGIMFDDKYSAAPLEGILQELLGDAVSDDILCDFLITAYEIEERRPKVFSSLSADGKNRRYFVRDLARATSAAPTFFEPARVEKLHQTKNFESLVDGGLFAANPSLVTLMHARRLGWNMEDITILSLGTGRESRPYLYNEVKKWGNISWILANRGVPIISMLLQSQTVVCDELMLMLLEDRYLRVDGPLLRNMGSDDLDDASDQNIRELEIFAESIMRAPATEEALETIADMA